MMACDDLRGSVRTCPTRPAETALKQVFSTSLDTVEHRTRQRGKVKGDMPETYCTPKETYNMPKETCTGEERARKWKGAPRLDSVIRCGIQVKIMSVSVFVPVSVSHCVCWISPKDTYAK